MTTHLSKPASYDPDPEMIHRALHTLNIIYDHKNG